MCPIMCPIMLESTCCSLDQESQEADDKKPAVLFPMQAWPFIKYDGMRKVWEEDPSCIKLREISKCSHLWPHMPLNMTQRKIMFATWGNVSIKELEIPNSWISKAMAQKLKKADAMLKQVNPKPQALQL